VLDNKLISEIRESKHLENLISPDCRRNWENNQQIFIHKCGMTFIFVQGSMKQKYGQGMKERKGEHKLEELKLSGPKIKHTTNSFRYSFRNSISTAPIIRLEEETPNLRLIIGVQEITTRYIPDEKGKTM
jgi:hypothetical protein